MINTKLEELVEMALDSLSVVTFGQYKHETMEQFELEFRRVLMRKYCNTTEVAKASHTYTLTGGTGVMGTWTTNTSKQQLNG